MTNQATRRYRSHTMGNGKQEHSITVQRICQQLIPTLSDHSMIVRFLQRVILHSVKRNIPKLPPSLITQLSNQLPNVDTTLLEILIDALDGVRMDMQEEHFKNFEEYDQYMQAKVLQIGGKFERHLKDLSSKFNHSIKFKNRININP